MDTITTVLTVISVAGTFSSILFAYLAFNRNLKKDTKNDAMDMTTIKIDLKYTRDGINRIEKRLDEYEKSQPKILERLGILEEKQHRNEGRLDKLEAKRSKKEI